MAAIEILNYIKTIKNSWVFYLNPIKQAQIIYIIYLHAFGGCTTTVIFSCFLSVYIFYYIFVHSSYVFISIQNKNWLWIAKYYVDILFVMRNFSFLISLLVFCSISKKYIRWNLIASRHAMRDNSCLFVDLIIRIYGKYF